MRRAIVAAVTAGLTIGLVTGCAPTDDTVKVCREQSTQQRAADDRCEQHTVGFVWWYLLRSQAPSVGKRISTGTATEPEGEEPHTVPRVVAPPEEEPPAEHAPVEEPVEPHVPVVVGGEK